MTSPPPGQPTQPGVDQFFDALTDEYAAAIERCFPRYREMLWALLEYLPSDLEPKRILELGAGTGNLSVLLAEKFPDAEIWTSSTFPPILCHSCRDRLGDDARFRFLQQDFRHLAGPEDDYDLVVSSIAIHHLHGEEKKSLFTHLHGRLRKGGVLAYADQHAGVTDEITQRHTERWREASMNAGSSESEWEMWMQHQRDHDHHDTVTDQIRWLQQAGFQNVDCPWRYLLWTVLLGTARAK